MGEETCTALDCYRPAARRGYCWSHYEQLLEGRTVLTELREIARSPWEALKRAALEYAADTERVGVDDPVKAAELADWKFRAAADRWRRRANRRSPRSR